MSLFNELKRRNVFKVTVAYIVMAWLMMQVADVILNNIGSPDWVFQVLLLFLAIGLPFAVFFAWAFEITPEGLKRESEVERSQSITPQTGKSLNLVIITALALALGYIAYDKFVLDASRDTALVESTTQALTEQASSDQGGNQYVPEKSIAVLPFLNMSSDPEQEYFSDGLSEELLNLLAKVAELRVTSRSSSFSYKGENLEIPEIARRLNVTHILEGSVRKAGEQVRITAQLIEASSDTHLWSETYDRSLDNIFAIQDEIASAVVAQLKLTLLGDVPMVRETDPQAYALYLQARHLRRQGTEEGIVLGIELLQQSLVIDPDYPAAWNELGTLYGNQANIGQRPLDEAFTLVSEANNRALAIDPEYAKAHASLSEIASGRDNDLAAAARHLERALQLEPGNAEIIREAALLNGALDRLSDAIKLMEFVVRLDPVSPASHSGLGYLYMSVGRFDEAIASFNTALRLSPDMIGARYHIGSAYLLMNEPQAAMTAIQSEKSDMKMLGLPLVYYDLGLTDESNTALAKLIEKYEQHAAYNIASIHAYMGQADRAFEWLDKAVQYKDLGLPEILIEPLFSNIHGDSRWLPFLASIGRSPEQLAAIEFEVILPE